jgi:hypothetical protein
MEWYPCKWCEGEGGWHAHAEPTYSDPGETIARLRAELEQARSQAYEECAKIAETFPAGYGAASPGLISQAIRQHSQKGEDVNE